MVRTLVKILIPCVLVLAVLIAAVSLESSTKKNPGLDRGGSKTQEQMAQAYADAPAATAQTEAPAQTTEAAPTETKLEERSYTLTFVGDCTFGASPASYYAKVGFVNTVGDDYSYPFANVIDWFENDDFTFLNMEGPLCDDGYPVNQNTSFHGPTDFVNILTENSVEGISIANNHIMDYGEKGYATTKETLKEAGVPFVEKDGTTVFTLEDGFTIGMYASTYQDVDQQAMEEAIRALKEQNVDLIVYVAHWGTENSYEITREQDTLGHAAIDAGAHIVYGSHPHVLQRIEEYNGGVIYYSMANFSFGGNAGPKDLDTAIIQQEIIRGADGVVTLGERTVIPCRVSSVPGTNNFQPTPYEEGSSEYQRVLKKLEGTY